MSFPATPARLNTKLIHNTMPTKRKIQFLNALAEHPLLSRRQLELYCRCTKRRTQNHLAWLRKRGYVQRYNAKQPFLNTRSLYRITEAGASLLPQAEQYTGCSSRRIARLILLLERVFKTRNLMLWLGNGRQWNWYVTRWDVEVGLEFTIREKPVLVPFHGAAMLERKDGHWLSAVVEFDTFRFSVESQRERLRSFVMAQDDPRFSSQGGEEFPALITVAADALRLQDYYSILRSVALSRRKPMPPAYLAIASEAIKLRDNPAAPIWYSTVSGRRTSLLFDADVNPPRLPPSVTWHRLPIAEKVKKEIDGTMPLRRTESVKPGLLGLACLALALEPIGKQLVDEIARHPLLAADELAQVLRSTPWYVNRELRQLTY